MASRKNRNVPASNVDFRDKMADSREIVYRSTVIANITERNFIGQSIASIYAEWHSINTIMNIRFNTVLALFHISFSSFDTTSWIYIIIFFKQIKISLSLNSWQGNSR